MAKLSELEGTKWAGTCELWLDPLGNEVTPSECTIAVDRNRVRYTWSHEATAHLGTITMRQDGADFVDSWHQPEPMTCEYVPGSTALFDIRGRYGEDLDWGWRIGLSLRTPTGELVLQMTNIAPWGEEARAVRMTCARRPEKDLPD